MQTTQGNDEFPLRQRNGRVKYTDSSAVCFNHSNKEYSKVPYVSKDLYSSQWNCWRPPQLRPHPGKSFYFSSNNGTFFHNTEFFHEKQPTHCAEYMKKTSNGQVADPFIFHNAHNTNHSGVLAASYNARHSENSVLQNGSNLKFPLKTSCRPLRYNGSLFYSSSPHCQSNMITPTPQHMSNKNKHISDCFKKNVIFSPELPAVVGLNTPPVTTPISICIKRQFVSSESETLNDSKDYYKFPIFNSKSKPDNLQEFITSQSIITESVSPSILSSTTSQEKLSNDVSTECPVTIQCNKIINRSEKSQLDMSNETRHYADFKKKSSDMSMSSICVLDPLLQQPFLSHTHQCSNRPIIQQKSFNGNYQDNKKHISEVYRKQANGIWVGLGIREWIPFTPAHQLQTCSYDHDLSETLNNKSKDDSIKKKENHHFSDHLLCHSQQDNLKKYNKKTVDHDSMIETSHSTLSQYKLHTETTQGVMSYPIENKQSVFKLQLSTHQDICIKPKYFSTYPLQSKYQRRQSLSIETQYSFKTDLNDDRHARSYDTFNLNPFKHDQQYSLKQVDPITLENKKCVLPDVNASCTLYNQDTFYDYNPLYKNHTHHLCELPTTASLPDCPLEDLHIFKKKSLLYPSITIDSIENSNNRLTQLSELLLPDPSALCTPQQSLHTFNSPFPCLNTVVGTTDNIHIGASLNQNHLSSFRHLYHSSYCHTQMCPNLYKKNKMYHGDIDFYPRCVNKDKHTSSVQQLHTAHTMCFKHNHSFLFSLKQKCVPSVYHVPWKRLSCQSTTTLESTLTSKDVAYEANQKDVPYTQHLQQTYSIQSIMLYSTKIQQMIYQHQLSRCTFLNPNDLYFYSRCITDSPHTLNPYRSIQLDAINSGTFCTVYKARFHNQIVAVKTPQLHHVTTDPEMMQLRALKEWRILTHAGSHPNILHIIGGLIHSPHEIWLVTDYIEGGDLYTLLYHKDPKCLSPIHRVVIMKQLASALNHLHQLTPKIVHKDLKTNNILITTSYHVRLCDFGDAEEIYHQNDGIQVYTAVTWQYAPPEIILSTNPSKPNNGANEKVDIWSLGCILLEICFKTTPFWDVLDALPPTSHQFALQAYLLEHQYCQRPIRLWNHKDTCPYYLGQLIDWCLQLNPFNRPSALQVSQYIHCHQYLLESEFKQLYDQKKIEYV